MEKRGRWGERECNWKDRKYEERVSSCKLECSFHQKRENDRGELLFSVVEMC